MVISRACLNACIKHVFEFFNIKFLRVEERNANCAMKIHRITLFRRRLVQDKRVYS